MTVMDRATGDDAPRRRRVLVVEDRALIAGKVAGTLSAAGYDVLGPAPTIETALALIRRPEDAPAAAVLDVDLRGELSYPLASMLRSIDTPILFLTGYGFSAIPAAWREVPRVEKPFETAILLDALRAVVAGETKQPSGPVDVALDLLPAERAAWDAVRLARDLAVERRIRGRPGRRP